MTTLRFKRVLSLVIFSTVLLSCTDSFAQTDSSSHRFNVNSIVSTERVDAFDSVPLDARRYEIRSVKFTGNRKTKEFVMEREMTFHAGDTISGNDFHALSDRSKKNLLNTSLFNFVTITYHVLPDTMRGQFAALEVNVDVKERWYFWPTPVFDVSEQNVNTWWRNGHNLQRASYGFFFWKYNFRGRRESVALIARFGYSEQFGGQYSIPSFNKTGTLGATFTYTYTRGHELSYSTQHNVLKFYKDPDHYLKAESVGSVRFNYREGIYINHTLDFKYSNIDVRDTVLQIASDYLVNSNSLMEYFTISYHVVRDYRDIKAYPLKGNFQELEITKHGLGILKDEKLNLFFIAAGVRFYEKLSNRIYFAQMLRARWMPSSNVPYYHQRALGFGPYVRGYEYYVVDGQDYVLAKATLRYELLKPHVYKFDFLPVDKFNTFHLALYPGIYCDAGYVNDRTSVASDHNYLGNDLLLGYGAGLDVVTYYDIAMRFEYTFNRLGENGFFFHLGAPF